MRLHIRRSTPITWQHSRYRAVPRYRSSTRLCRLVVAIPGRSRGYKMVTDVLVLGGGLPTTWAAVAARDANASTILVDKGVETIGTLCSANTVRGRVPW